MKSEVYIINSNNEKLLPSSKEFLRYSEIRVQNHCGAFHSFVVVIWNSLENIIIGNKCCVKTDCFKIISCPRLKSIEIGEQSFRNASFIVQSLI